MRILFIHNNFPAQYRHLATLLASDPQNKVGFITQNTTVELPGITKLVFEPTRKAHESTHVYVRAYENAVLEAQGVVRMLLSLKAKGFIPDVVCAHTGWGSAMFVKDIFPNTSLLLYCEWFTRYEGSNLDFDQTITRTLDEILQYRASNASILVDLDACDAGIAPTHLQLAQFPKAFQPQIRVLHDGIDTDYFQPTPGVPLNLADLDLRALAEVVTFVARGMDSYRGFPQFIEAIGKVLARRPHCHAVVVGTDRIAYGAKPPTGESWKTWILEELAKQNKPLDLTRVHFAGSLTYGELKRVYQASSVHVYLTKPFVLSWSLLEAMAMGCQIVASNTAPVQEVITDGVNGLLVDFFDVEALAARIESALDDQERALGLRNQARMTIVERYALKDLLPQHRAWVESYVHSVS